MAITADHATYAGAGSATNAASYTTGSQTPVAGDRVLVAVGSGVTSGTPNTPTIVGNGQTWNQIGVIGVGTHKLTLFECLVASPSAGTCAIAFGGQTQLRAAWSFVGFRSGLGTITLGTAATNSGTSTGASVVITDPGGGDGVFAASYKAQTGNFSAKDANYTQADQVSAGGEAGHLNTQYLINSVSDLTANWTISASVAWAASGVVLLEPSGPVTGSGAISNGHTVSASGKKIGKGSATLSHPHTVTPAGKKIGKGSVTVSHPHTVVASGTEVIGGPSTITHGHTVNATGRKLGRGSCTVSNGQTVSPTGRKIGKSSATISHPHTVSPAGRKVGQGSATISHPHTVVPAGRKLGRSSTTIPHGHTVVADGAPVGAIPSGSSTITHGHTVNATGQKIGKGSGTISNGQTATPTGRKIGTGSTTVSHGQGVVPAGKKIGKSSATVSHGHTVSASGVGIAIPSGSTSITHPHGVVAAGRKLASGTATITHPSAVGPTGGPVFTGQRVGPLALRVALQTRAYRSRWRR